MSRTLKIAVVVGVFPSVSETFIENQIIFLKQAGHEVEILCMRYIDEEIKINKRLSNYDLLKNTIEFRRLNLMPQNRFKRFLKATVILLKSIQKGCFASFLKSFNVFKYKSSALNGIQFYRVYYKYYLVMQQYDVVHIHFANYAKHLLPVLKPYKGQIIVSFHGYDAHKFSESFYEPLKTLPNVQYTVNTNYTKKNVLALGFSESKIHILPVGLDTSFFKPSVKFKSMSRFSILFIGRFVTFKAPLLAIKIVECLLSKGYGVQLNMVGSGPEFQLCQDYILEQHLEKHIQLLGNRTQVEIVALMDKSDVFLFPGIIDEKGRCENQGLVIQEAQSMELPVVISDVGGMQEGMLDQVTGVVLKAEVIDIFVSQLEYFIKHPKERISMGKAGRAFVTKHYDAHYLGDKLLKIYAI